MGNNDSQKQQDKNEDGSPDVTPENGLVTGGMLPHTDPDAGTGDPTDGRIEYQWSTRYPRHVRVEIYLESSYLFVLFVCSFFVMFAIWRGWISSYVSVYSSESYILKKYAFYAISGILGGVVFGIKYLYRVVARGYWHQDRRIWRLMSPFIAMAVAFIVGAMIDATLITTHVPTSNAAFVSIGFLAGYFADQAVAKMYDIATVIFGKARR